MSGQTRIACGFLGAAVLQDTQRWLSQRQAGPCAASRGTGRAGPGSRPGALLEPGQDMELTRRLAARLREEAAMAEAEGSRGTGLTGPHGRAHAVCYPGR